MPTPSTPTTKPKPLIWLLLAAGLLTTVTVLAYPRIFPHSSAGPESSQANAAATPDDSSAASVIRLSQQARANLGLLNGKVEIGSYWKKIQTTGIIADRPGFTDRNVTSPVDCVVTKVHAMEGDIVRPGDILFTLRIVSEYLQQAQSSYFKAFKEIDILNLEIKRIENLANLGVIPEKRIITLRQNITRQQVELDAHRQELLARGFNEEQLAKISSGQFIASIDVVAPQQSLTNKRNSKIKPISFPAANKNRNTFLEIQELNVQLGQQIKAGELLAILANHNYLYIKGHAFKKEAASISRAAENDWNVEVEFVNDASSDWEPFKEPLQIRHLSNTIDTANRTFDFFIPLNNQSRIYEKEGDTFVVWRFRPGQRVRIHIPAEEMQGVIVVPSESVINDGPEAYVFQQNGDLYIRIAVNVLHRDRLNTVIANDGTLLPGFFIAKNSAASLNRILKVQSASGENTGNFHVHADGSVHANH